ncbi:hypothetical protein K3495_g5653 [Podosphaera aphanis]|nr:hypothetical protein K3495_g5653 [Podosphaera aphanis]
MNNDINSMAAYFIPTADLTEITYLPTQIVSQPAISLFSYRRDLPNNIRVTGIFTFTRAASNTFAVNISSENPLIYLLLIMICSRDFTAQLTTDTNPLDPEMPPNLNTPLDFDMSQNLDIPLDLNIMPDLDMSLNLGIPLDLNMPMDLNIPLDFDMSHESDTWSVPVEELLPAHLSLYVLADNASHKN